MRNTAVVVLAALFVAGCGSDVRPPPQRVPLQTQAPIAKVVPPPAERVPAPRPAPVPNHPPPDGWLRIASKWGKRRGRAKPFDIEFTDAFASPKHRDRLAISGVEHIVHRSLDDGFEVHGWSHQQQRITTFRTDAMLSPVDPATGQAIRDIKQWLSERTTVRRIDWFSAKLEPPLRGVLTAAPGPRSGPRRYRVEIHTIEIVQNRLTRIETRSVLLRSDGSEGPAAHRHFGPRAEERYAIAGFTPLGSTEEVADPHAYLADAARMAHLHREQWMARTAPVPESDRIVFQCKPRPRRSPASAPPIADVPAPPGAPPHWLGLVRDLDSQSRLQTFQPFDVVFDYTDAGGTETKARRVTVGSFEITTANGLYRPGLLYVTGWCHLHREARSFRLDQMDRVTDPETGDEPADPRQWFLAHTRHR